MNFLSQNSTILNLKDRKPDEIFWIYHSHIGNNVPNIDIQRKFGKYISSKIKYESDFILITYSIKPNKKETDDKIYFENKDLLILLPRGMTIVMDKDYNYITNLTGSSKFSGADNLDEDDSEEGKCYTVYNSVKTISWVLSNSCEITKLTKANGKFSIMKIFSYKGKDIVLFGSKNMHYVCYLYRLDNFLKKTELSDIVKSIGEDINNNLENILKLKSYFDDGYSLVGELEDGMHFVPGDNTVSWFGLFKNGQPSEPLTTLEMLSNFGIKTVKSELVFRPGDDKDKLSFVLVMSRLDEGEGSVLYIRNITTDETQLVKSKSAIYKIKRMFRQKWLSNPVNIQKNFLDRIVETKDYHSLNTNSAIYMARKLLDFSLWLTENNYPVAVLDFKPIESVRGQISVGFSIYWEKFIEDTGTKDLVLSLEDFGDFNKYEFLSSPELQLMPGLSIDKRPLVIFFQDIQGGGKSTISNKLKNVEMIEQDICYGCTKITQFKLLNLIRNNKNVVVSRCNANEDHYKSYLKVALDNNCRVLFVSSEDLDSELRLAVSLAGILNRSSNGDSVLIGRKEYPFLDVIKFTTATWKSFKYHNNAIKIKTFENMKHLNDDFKMILKKGDEDVKNFIESNKDNLMKLRRPLDDIVSEIQDLIDNPPSESFVKKELKDVSYVSINIIDNKELINIVKKYCDSEKGSINCHHVTQVFMSKDKKSKKEPSVDIVPELEKCKIFISALIINQENDSSAFYVDKILDSKNNLVLVDSGLPHITGFLPIDSKAADSKKFVGKTDDSVKIIPVNLVEEGVCFWN